MQVAVLILFATRELGLSAGAIGLTYMFGGAGLRARGGVAPSGCRARFGVGPVIVYGLMLTAFGWQAFGLISRTGVASRRSRSGCAMLVFDFGAVLYGINYLSLRQAITPDRLLGRMTATMRFLTVAAAPLGSLAGGALATAIGLRQTLWVVGVLGIALAVGAMRWSPVRRHRTLADRSPPTSRDHWPPAADIYVAQCSTRATWPCSSIRTCRAVRRSRCSARGSSHCGCGRAHAAIQGALFIESSGCGSRAGFSDARAASAEFRSVAREIAHAIRHSAVNAATSAFATASAAVHRCHSRDRSSHRAARPISLPIVDTFINSLLETPSRCKQRMPASLNPVDGRDPQERASPPLHSALERIDAADAAAAASARRARGAIRRAAPDRRGRPARAGRDSGGGSSRRASPRARRRGRRCAPIGGALGAASARTRSRRHAGPPPLRMLCRRSNVEHFGDRAAASRRSASSYGATRADSRGTSAGATSSRRPSGAREQLAVEEVRGDRVGELTARRRATTIGANAGADRGARARRAPPAGRRTRARGRTGTCRCADGDDVVVEHAGVDRVRILLREHRARRVEAMPARDRLATLRASAAPDSAPAPAPPPIRAAAVDEELDAGRAAPAAKRVWLAAPSSPNCGAAGSGSCTAKCASSAKIARSTRVVVGASSERWKCATRFAGVKCTRPSARVRRRADGRRVGDPHRRRRRARGEQRRRVARRAREHVAHRCRRSRARAAPATYGRSCGGSTACAKPRAASARILARPCSAASRGLATCRALLLGREVAAREPRVVVRRPRDAVEVDIERVVRLIGRAATAAPRARVSPSPTPSAAAAYGSSGKRSTRAGAAATSARKSAKWRLQTSHRMSSVRLSGTGSSSPSVHRQHRDAAHRVDVVAKAFDGRAGVEDVDVAFVAEAFLLEHRARRRACRRARRRSPRAPRPAAGSRTPDAAASARR